MDERNAETRTSGHGLPCKLSCERCRSPIADEGRRMFMAFGPLFDFGFPPRLPPAFEPTCHIFYGARVIDIDDGLVAVALAFQANPHRMVGETPKARRLLAEADLYSRGETDPAMRWEYHRKVADILASLRQHRGRCH